MQREEFNTKIIKYVKEDGRLKDIKDYYSYKYSRSRGGWKSLNYLLDKNIVENMGEYFELIKSNNEELYFKDPKEIIQIIKEAGGYSFLAHPSAYKKGDKLPLEILEEWRDCGISGIECFSLYLKNIEDASYYLRFCEDNNLMVSAGSDCHGEFNNRILGIPKVSIDEIKMDFIKTYRIFRG